MFTGIIEKTGQIVNIQKANPPASTEFEITVQTGWSDLAIGESVSLNGVCLTVTQLLESTRCRFYVGHKTSATTVLSNLQPGMTVNLERALLPTTRLSGHWVQGHVDGVGQVLTLEPKEGCVHLEVSLPRSLSIYCVPRGSIAIQGVSLTIHQIRPSVDDAAQEVISIQLIPYTVHHTQFQALQVGDPVNIEVDILGKYAARLMEKTL